MTTTNNFSKEMGKYLLTFVVGLMLVLALPSSAFATGASTATSWNPTSPTSVSQPSRPVTSGYILPKQTPTPVYKPVYQTVVKPVYSYGNDYGYGYGYNNYGGYDYGGYGGNTYVLGLSYRGSDRTVINNTNTNTNVNNNGGYVPRHTVHYGDDDDDQDDEDAPRCELDASDTSADDGDRITLEWNTDGDIDEAYINNGIGDVDEDGGSERVRVTRDVTFRMTVRGPGGSDTCSVSVRVDEDNNDNDSNVVLLSEPTDNQLTSVYLSDLPYTGTEDDALVIGSIIATLLALMGGAWFFISKKTLPALAMNGTASIVPVLSQVMESTATASNTEATATVKHPATVDVHAFIEALIAENHAEAAEILEAEVAEGMSAKMFMIRAKNALNADVQSRDGEFVSPDAKVLDMTAELSTDTIRSIVSTLGQAIIARGA